MQVQIEPSSSIEKLTVDALAVVCFEADEKKPGDNSAKTSGTSSDPPVTAQAGWLTDMRASGEFTGKLYEVAILHRPQGTSAKRLVVVGGGKREKFTPAEARRVAGALVRALKCKGVRTISLMLNGFEEADYVGAAVEGAVLGAWESDKYKSDPKKNEKQIDSFTVLVSGGDGALQEAVRRSELIAEGQNLTRDLVN